MRAIDQHAYAIHLGDDLAAEIGQARILVVAAAAREIVRL